MKNLRINLLLFLIFLFVAVIISRLVFIQISQGDFYKALAHGLFNSPSQTPEDRGEIFFRNGEPLAKNKDFVLVFASPPKVKNAEETARVLSQILKLEENFILERLKTDKLYEPIKNKLTQEEIENLKKENLAGIYLGRKRGRYYPQEKLASQLIGFLDANGIGQYGLEEYYDEILKEGGDLILTLDYNVQFRAEKLLEKAKEELEIEGGGILVLDPFTGQILALANFPSFDPNKYGEYASEGDLGIFKNRLAQEIFEPGSIFKSITMAAALNEGKITPQTTYVDEGFVKIGQIPIFNYGNKVWGQRTMTEVLEKSINTGAVFAQSNLPHQIFLDYIQKFGIFKKTGIDLPERYSENREFNEGYEINFATASFGQGIEMTPIQIARAYSAIANGGHLVRPYLVDKILKDGKVIKTETEISPPVISSKTASQLTAMLVSVVENGFAKGAKIPGYYIAAKTGTAQISFSSLGIDKKGYSDKTWQTVVGFAPAFNSKFLILVKLDNPKTKTAEYSAVPIFQELADFLIHYYQIPYDYEID
jgi:cell division protein FtsI/penicillin-binding protein 2